MEGDFKSVAATAGYWDDKLYAWCTVYEPKEEILEISVLFTGDIIPAIENLAQEIFNKKLHPIFDQKFAPEEFFPLNKNEIDYLSAKWHYLMGVTTKKEVENSLQRLLEDN
ncbi:MAG: hypothetical protein PHH54_03475 [Candidatus Nanoarchaeia archaeon]|nr:hypothetical protein [Candidatus Nanoarchaeia archaeon]MDD5741018.1 hypothetical protein [Candidatus Nanoarchaeia archaeon]